MAQASGIPTSRRARSSRWGRRRRRSCSGNGERSWRSSGPPPPTSATTSSSIRPPLPPPPPSGNGECSRRSSGPPPPTSATASSSIRPPPPSGNGECSRRSSDYPPPTSATTSSSIRPPPPPPPMTADGADGRGWKRWRACGSAGSSSIRIASPGCWRASTEKGICPHVDLMRFEDGIAIVSLRSPCIMHFTPVEQQGIESPAACVPVLLTPGSLVVMSGEARYSWKHEINRKPGFQVWEGKEIVQQRRTSVTLRKLRPQA